MQLAAQLADLRGQRRGPGARATRCAGPARARRPARRGRPGVRPRPGRCAGAGRRSRARAAPLPARRRRRAHGSKWPRGVGRSTPASTSSVTSPSGTAGLGGERRRGQPAGDGRTLPDAVLRGEPGRGVRLVLVAGVERGELLADDLERQVPVALLAQHEAQPLDVGRAVLPVAGLACAPARRAPAPRGSGAWSSSPSGTRAAAHRGRREIRIDARREMPRGQGSTTCGRGPATSGRARRRVAVASISGSRRAVLTSGGGGPSRRPRRAGGSGGRSAGTCRSAPRRRRAATALSMRLRLT